MERSTCSDLISVRARKTHNRVWMKVCSATVCKKWKLSVNSRSFSNLVCPHRGIRVERVCQFLQQKFPRHLAGLLTWHRDILLSQLGVHQSAWDASPEGVIALRCTVLYIKKRGRIVLASKKSDPLIWPVSQRPRIIWNSVRSSNTFHEETCFVPAL